MRALRNDDVLLRRLADEAVAVVPGRDEAFLLDADLLAVYDACDGTEQPDGLALRRLAEAGLVTLQGVSRRTALVRGAAVGGAAVLVPLALPRAAAAGSVPVGGGPVPGGTVTITVTNQTCSTGSCPTATGTVEVTGTGWPAGATVTVAATSFTVAGSPTSSVTALVSSTGFFDVVMGTGTTSCGNSTWTVAVSTPATTTTYSSIPSACSAV